MKQPQYSPLSVAEMAVSLFAGNEGYLDDLPLNKVVDFERALLDFMNNSHAELLETINSTGDWNDDLAGKMKAALDDFKATGSW
jgi:F-type H+-transporting ATPase subunit alpha